MLRDIHLLELCPYLFLCLNPVKQSWHSTSSFMFLIRIFEFTFKLLNRLYIEAESG